MCGEPNEIASLNEHIANAQGNFQEIVQAIQAGDISSL